MPSTKGRDCRKKSEDLQRALRDAEDRIRLLISRGRITVDLAGPFQTQLNDYRKNLLDYEAQYKAGGRETYMEKLQTVENSINKVIRIIDDLADETRYHVPDEEPYRSAQYPLAAPQYPLATPQYPPATPQYPPATHQYPPPPYRSSSTHQYPPAPHQSHNMPHGLYHQSTYSSRHSVDSFRSRRSNESSVHSIGSRSVDSRTALVGEEFPAFSSSRKHLPGVIKDAEEVEDLHLEYIGDLLDIPDPRYQFNATYAPSQPGPSNYQSQ